MSSRAPVVSSSSAVFNPQPQETPLNDNALTQLGTIKRNGLRTNESGARGEGLESYLKKAAELLNSVVMEVNDRAVEERTRRSNRLSKYLKDGIQESEDEVREFQQFQNRAKQLTDKMDESIRRVVDDQTWAKNMSDSVQHVIDKSKEVQTRQTKRRRLSDQEDEDEDEEEQNDRRQVVQLSTSENATTLLHAAQSTAEIEWNEQTLTERYSEHPTYESFYKLKYDAQNSGENPPPIPHHTMWFAVEEGRNTQRHGTQRGTQRSTSEADESSEDEDTEVLISSENVSCKCPLTQTWFVEPMTSTKCPHTFEKDAILTFIRQSDLRAPLTPKEEAELATRYSRSAASRAAAENAIRATKPKAARCPDTGCSQLLTADEVVFDIVMQRKTRRAQEAEQKRHEMDLDDDDDGDNSDEDAFPGTQRRRRVVALGSSPAGRRRTLIKGEREVSVVPNSQATIGRSVQGVDDEETEDDDDDDDDDV